MIGLILSKFEKKISTEAGARGHGQRCNITLLHIHILNKTESAIIVFDVLFATKESSFRSCFIFTTAGVGPCGGRKKRTPYIIIM